MPDHHRTILGNWPEKAVLRLFFGLLDKPIISDLKGLQLRITKNCESFKQYDQFLPHHLADLRAYMVKIQEADFERLQKVYQPSAAEDHLDFESYQKGSFIDKSNSITG